MDADYFDWDPFRYTLLHYEKNEEFEFLVKTKVGFEMDQDKLWKYYCCSHTDFYLTDQCASILPKKLELLIQNWTQRHVPLRWPHSGLSDETEQCIKKGFNNDHSYEVLKILIQNAKKLGIDPNPKLGVDAEDLFVLADIHGVSIENFEPANCREWSFSHFAKRFLDTLLILLHIRYLHI